MLADGGYASSHAHLGSTVHVPWVVSKVYLVDCVFSLYGDEVEGENVSKAKKRLGHKDIIV